MNFYDWLLHIFTLVLIFYIMYKLDLILEVIK